MSSQISALILTTRHTKSIFFYNSLYLSNFKLKLAFNVTILSYIKVTTSNRYLGYNSQLANEKNKLNFLRTRHSFDLHMESKKKFRQS